MPFGEAFQGKSVLVTGHTGFKGSWLSFWLHNLGATVIGVALEPPTNPSHFKVANLERFVDHHHLDILEPDALSRLVATVQPDFVFHLAAQALVGRSYKAPIRTYETNAIGTVNLLESLRTLSKNCVAILVTSDKVYENREWVWGYRETDPLGGLDPYSASKAAAELFIRAQLKSFFPTDGNIRIGVGRAGNVIGGGDWAEDRIVPDLIRSLSTTYPMELRNPEATRPWQHVLEPLSGYLWLAARLENDKGLHGEPFNFGPTDDDGQKTVGELIDKLMPYLGAKEKLQTSRSPNTFLESNLLQLNCEKSKNILQWKSVLNFDETVRFTAEWYKNWSDLGDVQEFTGNQIDKYTDLATERNLEWTK